MKKIKTKLSVKIILMLFGILAALWFLTELIVIIFDISFEKDNVPTNSFFRLAVPIIGSAIIFVFAFVLNRTIVARIRRLKNATNQVTNGNFDTNLAVKGNDELSELTNSFNKMIAELKANEYLGKEFVRSISHEYKTPISSVKAYAELIGTEAAKAKPDKAALQEYSKIIMDESDRLALLSKSVLQLSMLDSTTKIKKEDTFSPAEQVRSILRLMQKNWSEKNIELDLQLENFTIKSNEQLLHQVWQNLISNAIKFSKPNGKISIQMQQKETSLYFEIADNGTGIKDEDKEKVFNQFFVADKSRNTEGSGLGLSIVKKIIEKLGGTISFETKENKGSKFMVEIK